jgi:hypothetical protein
MLLRVRVSLMSRLPRRAADVEGCCCCCCDDDDWPAVAASVAAAAGAGGCCGSGWLGDEVRNNQQTARRTLSAAMHIHTHSLDGRRCAAFSRACFAPQTQACAQEAIKTQFYISYHYKFSVTPATAAPSQRGFGGESAGVSQGW